MLMTSAEPMKWDAKHHFLQIMSHAREKKKICQGRGDSIASAHAVSRGTDQVGRKRGPRVAVTGGSAQKARGTPGVGTPSPSGP